MLSATTISIPWHAALRAGVCRHKGKDCEAEQFLHVPSLPCRAGVCILTGSDREAGFYLPFDLM